MALSEIESQKKQKNKIKRKNNRAINYYCFCGNTVNIMQMRVQVGIPFMGKSQILSNSMQTLLPQINSTLTRRGRGGGEALGNWTPGPTFIYCYASAFGLNSRVSFSSLPLSLFQIAFLTPPSLCRPSPSLSCFTIYFLLNWPPPHIILNYFYNFNSL